MKVELITAVNDWDLNNKMHSRRNCTIYLIGHWELSHENLEIAKMSNINLEPIDNWKNGRND